MKIKLPRAVGEEINYYRVERHYSDFSFDEYYEDILSESAYTGNSFKYIMSEPIKSDRNQRIVNLLTAWIDGWEVE